MDTHHTPTTPPAADSPDFAPWLTRRLFEQLKAARADQEATAQAVAKRPGAMVSDQTIYDNDKGEKKNPGMLTLIRHAQALGLNFFDLMDELRAEQENGG